MMRHLIPNGAVRAAAAAFFVGLVGAIAILGTSSGSPDRAFNALTNAESNSSLVTSSVAPEDGFELPSPPLIGAKLVEPAELSAEVSFPVYFPNDSLASSDLIQEAWVLPDGSMLCIVYSTGVLIYQQSEAIGDTPPPEPATGQGYGEDFGEERNDEYENFAAIARRLAEQDARDFGIEANDELGTVKGTVSFQVQYVSGKSFGVVEFSYGGDRISLRGLYDDETLTRIANSMS
jgi:hypothetical protein